jgi:hypothetical protein
MLHRSTQALQWSQQRNHALIPKRREASLGRSKKTQRVLTPTRPLRHARSDRARTNTHTTTAQCSRRFVPKLPSGISHYSCRTNTPSLCRCYFHPHERHREHLTDQDPWFCISHKIPESTSSHTSFLPKTKKTKSPSQWHWSSISVEHHQIQKRDMSSH